MIAEGENEMVAQRANRHIFELILMSLVSFWKHPKTCVHGELDPVGSTVRYETAVLVCIGEVTMKHSAWCPCVIIDYPARQCETKATFQNWVCIGDVTIKHRAWCPYVIIDYPARQCETKATFQNWVCIGEVTIKHHA